VIDELVYPIHQTVSGEILRHHQNKPQNTSQYFEKKLNVDWESCTPVYVPSKRRIRI
jgi:hypothetical protein